MEIFTKKWSKNCGVLLSKWNRGFRLLQTFNSLKTMGEMLVPHILVFKELKKCY